MKIGMILDSQFPPDPRVENEALSLIKYGHEVHLFCFDYSKNLRKTEVINGINVYRIRISKVIYSLSALAYTLPFYHIYLKKKLVKFLSIKEIEAIHIHDIQIARSVFWVNKKLKLPITLDLHENRPEIMKFYAHVNSTLGKLLISAEKWKKFEYKYIQKSDNVIVITEEAKQHYMNEIGVDKNKIHVVPNTVKPEFYTNFKKEEAIIEKYKDSFTLLYLGDTGLRRGLLTAIEALKYLTPTIPNIKLVFVGTSKEENILKNFVSNSNYDEYVDFEGWTEFGLFQSYILASDVGICPLHRNIHHDTTYANKIFQYMSFGLPVVVSDCLAQKRVVEQNNSGLVFKEKNAKDFSKKILSLYQNKDQYNHLKTNCIETITNHLNWDILSKELLNIYNNERNINR